MAATTTSSSDATTHPTPPATATATAPPPASNLSPSVTPAITVVSDVKVPSETVTPVVTSIPNAPVTTEPNATANAPQSPPWRVVTALLRRVVQGELTLEHIRVEESASYIFEDELTAQSRIVLYEVTVATPSVRWSVLRRYSDFAALNLALECIVTPDRLPPFPEKAYPWTDHFNSSFISSRRVLLNNYLMRCITSPRIRSCRPMLSFLIPDPDDIPTAYDFKERLFEPRPSTPPPPPLPAASTALPPDAGPNATATAASGTDEKKKAPPKVEGPDSASAKACAPLVASSAVFESSILRYDFAKRGYRRGKPSGHTVKPYVSDEVSDVSIPYAQIVGNNDHTVYHCHVHNAKLRRSFSQWTVLKRYDDFKALDTAIRTALAQRLVPDVKMMSADIVSAEEVFASLPELPVARWKLFTDHFEPRFIEGRRLLLQHYLRCIIHLPVVADLPAVLEFVGVTKSKSKDD